MYSPSLAIPRLCAIFLLLVLAAGCAARGGGTLVQPVRATPQMQPVSMPAEARVWVETQGTAGEDLQGILVALLQSERNMRLADSAKDADCIIRITVRETGQTDSRNVGPSFEDGARGATLGLFTGATLGAAVGSRGGVAWGAGIGTLLGLSLGLASSADQTSLVWAMRADVVIERQRKGQKTVAYQGEMLAVAEGVNMRHADAIASLENLLAREIVNAITTEGA